MLGSTATIARNTFVESIRQPIFFMVVLASAFLQLLNTWIAGFSMGMRNVPGEVTADDKLLFDIGLSTVFVCGMLLAAFVATAVISREIEDKTILTIVSKPVSRVSVVIGKYLGVSGAMAVAIFLMIVFLLMGIRHGVLTTAADDPDMPVIYASMLIVFGSLIVAAAGNYMYGWPFGQTTIILMVPLAILGYLAVLLINEDWEFQPILTEVKPQLMLACVTLSMALFVLTAVATAASTRLGQVMTITVCAGVFVLGLLSNHFIGRHVFDNPLLGVIAAAEADDMDDEAFDAPGDVYHILLKQAPDEHELGVGDLLYWGPAPNGVSLDVPEMTAPGDGVDMSATMFPEGTPSGIVIVDINDLAYTVKQIGHTAVPVRAPPREGAYVFARPTRVNAGALAAWSVVPNMHFFWTVDAITQAKIVPLHHIGLVVAYALTLIVACLSVAVFLFQGRDVG